MNDECLSVMHWYRTWRAQISYARNAKSFEEYDKYCQNAIEAQAQMLVAEVLGK